jgi:hypothetical protein
VAEHGKIPPGKCANCHAPLRGPYCFVCGQRVVTHIHSFWEFVQEAFEGITHADSRVWRTVWPLLFKPGFLTVEYFSGRRARYLPPFRLYLVLSILFFLVAAAVPREVALFNFETREVEGVSVTTPFSGANTPRSETPEQRADRVCNDMSYQGPWQEELNKRFMLSCRKMILDEGHGLVEGMLHNVPRALFVLLPLLALVMRLMYLRRYYVEHLLFFIHAHSFIFLLLLLYIPVSGWIDDTWIDGPLTLIVWGYIPWYLFRAMRRTYEQSRLVTFAKYFVLMIAYFACAAIMLVITTLYTIVTL